MAFGQGHLYLGLWVSAGTVQVALLAFAWDGLLRLSFLPMVSLGHSGLPSEVRMALTYVASDSSPQALSFCPEPADTAPNLSGYLCGYILEGQPFP